MNSRKHVVLAGMFLLAGLLFAAGPAFAMCGNCNHGDAKAASAVKCDSTCAHFVKGECKGKCDASCKADCKEHCKGDCKGDCKGKCVHANSKNCPGTCKGGTAQHSGTAGCPMHANAAPTDTTKAKK
jgi:hypothetical protein